MAPMHQNNFSVDQYETVIFILQPHKKSKLFTYKYVKFTHIKPQSDGSCVICRPFPQALLLHNVSNKTPKFLDSAQYFGLRM